MGSYFRAGILLALCVIGLTACSTPGEAVRTKAGRGGPGRGDNNEPLVKDAAYWKSKFNEVLKELQENKKFKEARERNEEHTHTGDVAAAEESRQAPDSPGRRGPAPSLRGPRRH